MGFGNKLLKLEKTQSKQRNVFILRSQGGFFKVITNNTLKILKKN